jgi:hypothetical protein
MKYGVFALILLAAGIAAFLLFKGNPTPSEDNETATTTAPRLTIRAARIDESTDTYTVEAQYPRVGVPAIDTTIEKTVRDAIAAFKSDTAGAPPVGGMKYEFGTIYEVPYAGEDVISVKLTISTYTGGAHPLAMVEALNFDRSGRGLTLDDALTMTGLTLQEVAARSLSELREKHGATLFEEGAAATRENYGTFLIDGDSVTFVFQLYQVASYAAGFQEVTFARKK